MLYKSVTNTDLTHLNICFWYLWHLTTNLMRLISVNQSWTTRMMWHTDIRKAAWCKDCNNNKNTVKLIYLKHWYLKYYRYVEKCSLYMNEPISAHRILSVPLHCDCVQALSQWNRVTFPSADPKSMSYMNTTCVPTCISTQFSAVLYSGGIFFSWRIILSRTEGLMMGWKIKNNKSCKTRIFSWILQL